MASDAANSVSGNPSISAYHKEALKSLEKALERH